MCHASDDNKAPLYKAIRHRHVDCVKRLVKAEADVNSEIKDAGETMLIFAVRKSDVGIVEVLINAGADVNLAGTYHTPLFEASYNGRPECMKLLIDAGADVNIPSLKPETPLSFAVMAKNCEDVRLLVQSGADVNLKICDIVTPVMYAARGEMTDLLACLIELGSGLNHRDRDGNTPLIKAAENGLCESIKLLVEAGADLNLSNYDGETALMLAAGNLHSTIVKQLLKKGARVNLRDNRLENALEHYIGVVTPHVDIGTVLLAAGETFDNSKTRYVWHSSSVYHSKIFQKEEEIKKDLHLKHLCRKSIRKHLLQISPVNLFFQVPQLGLPTSLQKYLLYDVWFELCCRFEPACQHTLPVTHPEDFTDGSATTPDILA